MHTRPGIGLGLGLLPVGSKTYTYAKMAISKIYIINCPATGKKHTWRSRAHKLDHNSHTYFTSFSFPPLLRPEEYSVAHIVDFPARLARGAIE